MIRHFFITTGLVLAAIALEAGQNSIQISGSAQPGCWSVEQIVGAVTKGAHNDREKALALHHFGMQHFIHFDGPIEERGDYITDPIKLIAVYGYALCGNNSAAMNALYNAAGLKARRRSMPGHSVPEVWFEGKWNYIDTDMFGYVFLPDGQRIASVDELSKDPGLFQKQATPPSPFYPFDRKEDMAGTFRGVDASRDYHPYTNAHLMNLSLRANESARLFFKPQGEGRYYLTPAFRPDLGIQYKDYYLTGPVRKGSLAWTDHGPASYANGLLEYRPDLRSEAFAVENPERQGVIVKRGRRLPALAAAEAGKPASLVVRVTTPWIISGLQNDLTNFEDNTDAAVVSGIFWRTDEGDQNRILVSRDNGATWTRVWENRYLGAVPFKVDLTRWADGEFGYQVKFEWVDRKGSGQAGVEALRFRTWVELSPMALARMVPGKNNFDIAAGNGRAVYTQSRWDRNQAIPGQTLENLTAFDHFPYLRPTDASKPGTLSFPLRIDGDVDELRLSVLARAAHGSQGVLVVMSLSTDDGATWKELERFTPDPGHTMNEMWFNHVIRNRTFQGGHVRVRMSVSGGGLEKVFANAVVREPSKVATDLRVTHLWREGEQPKSFSHVWKAGARDATYSVEAAAAGIVNDELRIEALTP
ncbi:MAG: hypothetical protein NTY38_14035 [Acidobacteria bacterium]|nr:hypothetical protein [Acidobacteriota bacterium]